MNETRPANMPRIIRKVTKVGRDGLPKVARDRKTGLLAERVRAQGQRPCDGEPCVLDKSVWPGSEYVRITDLNLRPRRGYTTIPISKDYHWCCIPEKYEPLTKYLWRMLAVAVAQERENNR